MHNPIPLDVAGYRTGLAGSLWQVIMDRANDEECSQVLIDLLSLACDINSEAHLSLQSELSDPVTTDIPAVSPAVNPRSTPYSQFWEVRNEAENALNSSKEAREVLDMWIDTLPAGDEHEPLANKVSVVFGRVHEAIIHLEKAVAIKGE